MPETMTPDSHTCVRGPLCEGASSPEAECRHQSCPQIYFAEWQGCPGCQEPDDYDVCEKHGYQHIVETQGFTGFAGGNCYWWKLECGCMKVDESDDVRAAY